MPVGRARPRAPSDSRPPTPAYSPRTRERGFEASLALPAGIRRLRVGVPNEQSDAWGSAILEIGAPASPAKESGFSSVVLSSGTSTVESGTPSPDRAFQFGRTHFRSGPDGVVRQDATLGAFYFFDTGEPVDDSALPEVVAE